MKFVSQKFPIKATRNQAPEKQKLPSHEAKFEFPIKPTRNQRIPQTKDTVPQN